MSKEKQIEEDRSGKEGSMEKQPSEGGESASPEGHRLKFVAGNLAEFGLREFCRDTTEGVHCFVQAAAILSGIATVKRPDHLSPDCIGQSQFALLVLNPVQRPADWLGLLLEPLRDAQSAHQSVSNLYDPEQLKEAAASAVLERTAEMPAMRQSKVEIQRRVHRGAFVKPGPSIGLRPEWDDMALLEHESRLQKLLCPTILVEGDSLLALADLLHDTHLNEPIIYLKWPQRGSLSPRELHQLIRGHTLPKRKGQKFPVTVRAGVFMEVAEETAIEWTRTAEDSALAGEMVYLNPLSDSIGREYRLPKSSSTYSFLLEFERVVREVLSRRYLGESDLPTDPKILALGKKQHRRFCWWLRGSSSPDGADCPGHRLLYLSIFHLFVELAKGSVGAVEEMRLHLLAYEIARLAVLESSQEKSRLNERAKRSAILPDCLRLLSKLSTDEGLSHRDIQRKHNKLPKPKLQHLLESLQEAGLVTELEGKVYLTDEDVDEGKVVELLGIPAKAAKVGNGGGD